MRIQCTIEGYTPLICNKFSDEAALTATSATRSSSAGRAKGTPLEQAEKKLYIGLDGEPMIPQPNIMRSIVDGGKFMKIGKAQVTTLKTSLLYACLNIDGAEIKIVSKEPWRVDTRAVVVPSTGGRILAHRPMFDEWKLSFEMELDEDMLDPKSLRQIVDDAGKKIGLGDFRPARKGPYGKYRVTSWSEME